MHQESWHAVNSRFGIRPPPAPGGSGAPPLPECEAQRRMVLQEQILERFQNPVRPALEPPPTPVTSQPTLMGWDGPPQQQQIPTAPRAGIALPPSLPPPPPLPPPPMVSQPSGPKRQRHAHIITAVVAGPAAGSGDGAGVSHPIKNPVPIRLVAAPVNPSARTAALCVYGPLSQLCIAGDFTLDALLTELRHELNAQGGSRPTLVRDGTTRCGDETLHK